MVTGKSFSVVQIEHVVKKFDGMLEPAVNDVSFTLGRGELLVLLGSSGCGKSTTLKMINRLIEPDSGEIYINGQSHSDLPASQLRRSIGYVIQNVGLFPHWSIEENVGSSLRVSGVKAAERRRRCLELLELVGLNPDQFKHRFPTELSGGQKQRVGVARALAADPQILLMDEPFGALDGISREMLQDELVRMHTTLSKTILLVTHDLFEALTLADRIGVMHDGRLEQIGTPSELLKNPKTSFVRALFEKPAKQLEMFARNKKGHE